MKLVSERVVLRLWTQKELAALLGVPPATISTRLRNGTFPPPTRAMAKGSRRYYSEQDVQQIVKTYKEGA
jgi:DNA-binding transcriptional MerR regulator